MPIKPTLFVGSSSEALAVARQFAESLQDVTHAIVWKDAPEFEPMRSTLEGLLNIAERYDFGVFIFTPDDEITSRGVKGKVARDNVILELGVFLGSLGSDRAFAVVEEGSTAKKKLKAISDLFGITLPKFAKSPAAALIASVAVAVNQLRPKIVAAGRRSEKVPLLQKSSFDLKKATFHATLSANKLLAAQRRLADRRIALACRRRDGDVNAEDDPRLAFSQIRTPSKVSPGDIVLRATNKKILGVAKAGDFIEGYILLVPEGVSLKRGVTIAELIAAGCDIADGVEKRATK
ncbi:MAG TPA: nucleotide-binding protein [Thermoanaerobaculia bacterium]|nr:nucleotide-binding protein [Thermoanaerobaculia bacterium]